MSIFGLRLITNPFYYLILIHVVIQDFIIKGLLLESFQIRTDLNNISMS